MFPKINLNGVKRVKNAVQGLMSPREEEKDAKKIKKEKKTAATTVGATVGKTENKAESIAEARKLFKYPSTLYHLKMEYDKKAKEEFYHLYKHSTEAKPRRDKLYASFQLLLEVLSKEEENFTINHEISPKEALGIFGNPKTAEELGETFNNIIKDISRRDVREKYEPYFMKAFDIASKAIQYAGDIPSSIAPEASEKVKAPISSNSRAASDALNVLDLHSDAFFNKSLDEQRKDIQTTRNALARALHPDKHSGVEKMDFGADTSMARFHGKTPDEAMQDVNNAYETLKAFM
jgi:hypothetical protein